MPFLPTLVKAVTTALVVICAAKAAEALGPRWGAIIASLPVSAGPAYVFLALEHPADFVAASALVSATANAATGLFLVSYGMLARRVPVGPSLVAALGVWAATAILAQYLHWTVYTVVVANIAVYGLAIAIVRTFRSEAAGSRRPLAPTWFDLPLRAALIALFVCLVVAGSAIAGPTATGIAAVFPVSLTSLLLLLRSRIGATATAVVATNALAPMLGFGAMLILLHLAIPRFGLSGALCAALGFSLAWSAGLILSVGMRRT